MKLSSSLAAAAVCVVLAIAIKFAQLPNNFAAFGAAFIFCGAYLRGAWAWGVPLAGLAASDFLGQALGIPGVYAYAWEGMLLNYLGFAAMAGVGTMLRRRDDLPAVVGVAILGSVVYALISNFGSWLDPQMHYERTFAGLMHCYYMAIPFMRGTLSSDLFFTILFVMGYQAFLATRPATESASTKRT